MVPESACAQQQSQFSFSHVSNRPHSTPKMDPGERRGRNRWRGTRERDRLKARFQIHERMREKAPPLSLLVASAITRNHEHYDTVITSHEPCDSSTTTDRTESFLSESSIEMLQLALQRIGKNNVSFFSLQCMNQHSDVFNAPFPIADVIWWTQNRETKDNEDESRRLVSEPQLLSRWGEEKLRSFKQDFLPTRCTCTLLEWIVWTGRYNILPSLLLGGIDVTLHGSSTARLTTSLVSTPCRMSQHQGLGKTFFQLQAPSSLKAYLVKRVFELRKKTLVHRRNMDNEDLCQMCHVPTPNDCAIQFDTCGHLLCDACLWNDIVDHCVARFDRQDIFVCPICDHLLRRQAEKRTDRIVSRAEAQARREETTAKFNALPVSIGKSGKTPKLKSRALCSSWVGAIHTGSSQAIRMEKFFKALDTTMHEASSYNYVWRYLQEGVDVNARGEYGQTGLWIAVWKGNTRLVRLLLDYGSDPNAASHGGITPVRLARAFGHTEILELLIQMGGDDTEPSSCEAGSFTDFTSSILPSFACETLIDVRTDHTGAGSYIFDNFLHDTSIEALLRLRNRIPVAPSIKSPEKPCSIRSYYCDALGFVVHPLTSLLIQAFGTENIKVFAYMRFLCYQDAGVELAPHVDLARVDPDTGLRSTHSFLLYLTTCDAGGETALLQGLPQYERTIVLAKVHPVRGRLLIFPHQCPHEGVVVIDVPKHLIRGEVYIPNGYELIR